MPELSFTVTDDINAKIMPLKVEVPDLNAAKARITSALAASQYESCAHVNPSTIPDDLVEVLLTGYKRANTDIRGGVAAIVAAAALETGVVVV
jgi:hypothetical protein